MIRQARTQQIVPAAEQPGRARQAGGLATQRRRSFKISESSLGFPSTALRLEDKEAKGKEIPQNQGGDREQGSGVGGGG